MELCIVIPAYNELERLENTLLEYIKFFDNYCCKKQGHSYEIVVVFNGCSDKSPEIIASKIQSNRIIYHTLTEKGKGLAIRHGFKDALSRQNQVIGFVDADMSTKPKDFSNLLNHIDDFDSVIASRYMPGSDIYPPRPKIKRWGSRYTYELLIRRQLGLKFNDFQCGAKIFKREAITKLIGKCQINEWAFDLELLYLLNKHNFNIKEIPTTWRDQPGSKLNMLQDGLRMLGAIWQIKHLHTATQPEHNNIE